MRKCAALALALLTVFCISLPGQVSAQSVWVGGGVSVPTGDFYGDHASHGFHRRSRASAFPVGPGGPLRSLAWRVSTARTAFIDEPRGG